MVLTDLVFASQNQGKVKEVRAGLAPFGITVKSVADFEVTRTLVVAETAATFEGNAELKARAYAQALSLPVLADDSGLEVATLGDEPGVASNRWFPGSDADRTQALLQRLGESENRAARFVTVLCFFDPHQPAPVFFRGVVEGTLTTEPRGSTGFGYDPIFLPAGYTQTFAELGMEVKNTLSHRGRALQAFTQWLENQSVK